ncbi:MAG TPA: hypothetical protein VF369_08145 [candidate division Zixibacteria bacterium]
MPEPKFEYKDIIGVSKQKDPKRIPAGYVRYAMNVDSDNDKKLHRRRGRTLLDDENTHSMWSNATICLCVQAGDLKEATLNLNTMTFTYTTILGNVGDTEMIFQEVADMVFFSNGEKFGYIRDRVAHGIPEVDQEFKDRMAGGHLMEYWDSRLWVFQDNLLHYSDATEPWVRDKRHNFVSFNSKGRMLRAVKDGLYVSDCARCGFLHGGSGDPPKFNYTEVCNFPAIEGMAISSAEQVSGISMKVALWATEDGFYRGLPGGQVNRVTGDHFLVNGAARGRVMVLPRTFKNQVKVRQFLGTYDLHPGYGGAEMALEIPAIEISGRITTA